MSQSTPITYKVWDYNPSIAGGVIGATIFAVLTILHGFRLFKNRTWFCIPFVIGGLFETIGYAARAAAHDNTDTNTPYIIQSVLILVAPILFAASIYMILGRLILCTNSTSLSVIRPRWITSIFVISDILCFFIQAGGAGMLVQADDDAGFKRGENIILGGLILQILMFCFFVLVAAMWHRRLNVLETPAARTGIVPWRKYIGLLYIASICIAVRNTCRVVEYATGHDGYLTTHEWPLYIYDFLLMMIALGVCISWYDPNIKLGRKSDGDIGLQG